MYIDYEKAYEATLQTSRRLQEIIDLQEKELKEKDAVIELRKDKIKILKNKIKILEELCGTKLKVMGKK